MASRRTSRALLAMLGLALIATCMTFSGGVAQAQTPAPCVPPPSYNPAVGVAADPVVVVQGQPVVITGTGFPPNCTIEVTVGGITKVVVTDGNGNFSVSFSTAGLPLGANVARIQFGDQTLTAGFTVIAAAVQNPAVTSGPLPTTGSSSTLPFVQAGLALVVVGGLLLYFARRRRMLSGT